MVFDYANIIRYQRTIRYCRRHIFDIFAFGQVAWLPIKQTEKRQARLNAFMNARLNDAKHHCQKVIFFIFVLNLQHVREKTRFTSDRRRSG